MKLKRIWGRIADETGWHAEREQEAVSMAVRESTRQTAIETAKKLLDFGIPVDKIAVATKLTVEEVMELAKVQC